jgi:hypothetical protein
VSDIPVIASSTASKAMARIEYRVVFNNGVGPSLAPLS